MKKELTAIKQEQKKFERISNRENELKEKFEDNFQAPISGRSKSKTPQKVNNNLLRKNPSKSYFEAPKIMSKSPSKSYFQAPKKMSRSPSKVLNKSPSKVLSKSPSANYLNKTPSKAKIYKL